jgi:hypothetical protein
VTGELGELAAAGDGADDNLAVGESGGEFASIPGHADGRGAAVANHREQRRHGSRTGNLRDAVRADGSSGFGA